jgi:hypothetical protein
MCGLVLGCVGLDTLLVVGGLTVVLVDGVINGFAGGATMGSWGCIISSRITQN